MTLMMSLGRLLSRRENVRVTVIQHLDNYSDLSGGIVANFSDIYECRSEEATRRGNGEGSKPLLFLRDSFLIPCQIGQGQPVQGFDLWYPTSYITERLSSKRARSMLPVAVIWQP